MPWTYHTGNAAAAVQMAEAFRHDPVARRHFLECAFRDLAAARVEREASRPARYLRT